MSGLFSLLSFVLVGGGEGEADGTLTIEATLNLSPVKSRAGGRPIPVQGKPPTLQKGQIATLSTGCVRLPCSLRSTFPALFSLDAFTDMDICYSFVGVIWPFSEYRLYPILPQALAEDIQQFVESDFAKQYFSTHKTGFIFRRKVPMEQMMTWQKVRLFRCSSTPIVILIIDLILCACGRLRSPALFSTRTAPCTKTPSNRSKSSND